MNTNKDGWIIVLWLSLTVLHVAPRTWNWFQAQKLCAEKNDSLVKTHLSNSPAHDYWTSQYRRFSFWIKILGCYIDINNDNTQNFPMQIPSAGFCQEICATRNSSIFGIKQKECRCFGRFVEDQLVSLDHCNTVPQSTDDIIFKEHGGDNSYTLYESDFNVKDRRMVNYVAVQCDSHKRFFFQSDSSSSYKAVCQNSVPKGFHSWMSSMEICKNETSSYLAGNISLNDINQTCDRLNVTLSGHSWLGVANELYTGFDRGVPVSKEESTSFLQCGLCIDGDCVQFKDCTKRVNVVYCEMGFNTGTSDHGTTTDNPGRTQSVTHTSEASKHTETSTNFIMSISTTSSVIQTSKQDVTNSSNTLSIIIPLVMTAILIGCLATAAVFYIRRKTGLRNQNNKQLDSNETDNNYTDIDIDVKNKNYFFLEPQSETNYNSPHVVQTDESNPYKDTAEGIYDHLRDEESRKRNKEDGKENDSNPYKETDGGLYDHLRDTEFGKSTEENNYDHAPAAAEQDSSAHGRMNEHTSDNDYDHAMSFYNYKQHNQVIEETDGGYAKTVNVS